MPIVRRALVVAAITAAIVGVYLWRRRHRAHVRITAATLALTSLYTALRVR